MLGPKLFTISCNSLERVLRGAHTDDDISEPELKSMLETMLAKHQKYMSINLGIKTHLQSP